MYVDDVKVAGKTENIGPTWKILMKDVDLGEPTSFLDHVYLRCIQRECKTSKGIVDNYKNMFESRISGGAKEKLHTRVSGNLMQKQYLLRPMTRKVMQRYVWNDIANLRIKRLNNYTKLLFLAWMIIKLRKKKMSQ